MSNQFNIEKKTVIAISNLTLSAAYQNSALLDTSTCNFLGLYIKYTKGDETGLKVKVEGTLDVTLGLQSALSAATWYQRVSESTTAGVTTITANNFEMTATGNYLETISPIKTDGIKVSVIADTLGSSPGTVTIYLVTSWV